MYWGYLRKLAIQTRRSLGIERQPGVDKTEETLQLSEAIIAYGEMIQMHYSALEVIVEVTELARRFRETPQAMNDALLILQKTGRAYPTGVDGRWKLQDCARLESRLSKMR